MRISMPQPIPIGLASLALWTFAGTAQAGQIDVLFFGTIDFPASSGLEEGDEVQGSFSYDSSATESSTGNFPDTVTNLELILIDVSENGGFETIVVQPDGDIFIGPDSFELYYGPDVGQLGDNFGLNLNLSSVAFGQSLETATDELVNAGPDALNLFNEEATGFIQNDDTFEDLSFVVTYIEFTPVPEPTSLAILALGGAAVLRRRR